MAVTRRLRKPFNWRSPWLIGFVGLAVLATGVGIAYSAGIFTPGGQHNPAVLVTPTASTAVTPTASTALTPTAVASPSPSPSETPTPEPSGSPSPAPTASPGVAGLDCTIGVQTSLTGHPQAGWITFPGGANLYDPAGEVKLPDGSSPFGLTHDLALNRWIGVPREWVAPDGLRYAFVAAKGAKIGFVDKKGVTRLYLMPAGAVYSEYREFGGTVGPILSAATDGVYVRTDPGLVFVGWDGVQRSITRTGYWHAVDGRAAYGTAEAVPANTGSDWGPGAWGETYTILRLNLSSGTVTNFFSKPHMKARVMGFGWAGAPVVETADGKMIEVWLVGATPVKVASHVIPPRADARWLPYFLASATGDRHGTWLFLVGGPSPVPLGGSGVWLYTSESGLELASDFGGLGAWFATSCR